jgi:DNA-binding transcriptional ArsR family regulator
MVTAMHYFKADLFKALGHPVRLRILETLRSGEKTVGELHRALAVEPSSVSQQLAILRHHQLVDARKDGTSVWYRVRDPLIYDILDKARAIFEHQVSAMSTALAQDGPSHGNGPDSGSTTVTSP